MDAVDHCFINKHLKTRFGSVCTIYVFLFKNIFVCLRLAQNGGFLQTSTDSGVNFGELFLSVFHVVSIIHFLIQTSSSGSF